MLLWALLVSLSLAASSIMEVNDSVEHDFVQTLNTQEYLIMFQADWCGGCRQFKPTFAELAEWLHQHHPQVQAVAINHDHSAKIASRFLITMLPTLYHVRAGEFRDVTMKMYSLREYFDQAGWQQLPPNRFFAPTGQAASLLAQLGGLHGWLQAKLGGDLLRLLLLTLCGCVAAILLKNIYRTLKQIRQASSPKPAQSKPTKAD